MTTVKRVIPEARQIAKTCIVLLSKIDLLLYFHNINWAPIVKGTAFHDPNAVIRTALLH